MAGGGHTTIKTPPPTPAPAVPTRTDSQTQAMAAAQAKKYVNPNTFINTILTNSRGRTLGGTSGSGSSLLGG